MHPKNTLYSIAWGLLQLPAHDGTQQAFRRIREFKRAITDYAHEQGWGLRLIESRWGPNGQPFEEYELSKRVDAGYRSEFAGTLQECCLKIVEEDIARTEPGYREPEDVM